MPAAAVAAAHALARLAWPAPPLLRALARAASARRPSTGCGTDENRNNMAAYSLLEQLDTRGACMLAWAAAVQYVLAEAQGVDSAPGGDDCLGELRSVAAGLVADCIAYVGGGDSSGSGSGDGRALVVPQKRPAGASGLSSEGGAQLHQARLLLHAAYVGGSIAVGDGGQGSSWAALGDDTEAAVAICGCSRVWQQRGLAQQQGQQQEQQQRQQQGQQAEGQEREAEAVLRVLQRARGAWEAAQGRKQVSGTQRDVWKVSRAVWCLCPR
jgi:hypothetical protein